MGIILDIDLRKNLGGQLIILFVSLSSLSGFLLTAFFRSSFNAIDVTANFWSASIHVSSFTWVAEMVAYGFDTSALLVVSFSIVLFLLYKRNRKETLLLVGAMSGDAVIVETVKMLVHSARPLDGIMYDTGFSFPSGHVTSAVVLLGLVAYFARQHWKSSNTKKLLNMLLIALASLVGFTRVYLNVHWFSDVFGGYLLGAFWLTSSILVFQYLKNVSTSTSVGIQRNR
jgi:membrane-associated phospholipid phosphatase